MVRTRRNAREPRCRASEPPLAHQRDLVERRFGSFEGLESSRSVPGRAPTRSCTRCTGPGRPSSIGRAWRSSSRAGGSPSMGSRSRSSRRISSSSRRAARPLRRLHVLWAVRALPRAAPAAGRRRSPGARQAGRPRRRQRPQPPVAPVSRLDGDPEAARHLEAGHRGAVLGRRVERPRKARRRGAVAAGLHRRLWNTGESRGQPRFRRFGVRPLPVPQVRVPLLDYLAYDLLVPIVRPKEPASRA